MARPASFFQKRNSTRLVIRNRISVTRTTTTTPAPPPATTKTAKPTVLPKATRKVMRRKITRIPNLTTKTEATTKNYEQFIEVIDDEIAGVLPALTSAKPRKSFRPATTLIESTTRALLTLQPNQFEEQKVERKQSSFDKILEQQYKIKGIDVNDEDSYEEDERLIGVLGSQV